MRQTITKYTFRMCWVFVVILLAFAPVAFAQDDGDGGDDGGDDDSNFPPVAGVQIDPQGVLQVMQSDPRVTQMQLMAARQSLPPRLARPSKLRKVSLNRLEKAVAKNLESGNSPTPEMLALAGLTRLEYVFFYPESGDIVIAGPAEGFGRDSVGRIVGVESWQPCLLLEDVVVALRAFPPGNASKANTISVSIDPTPAGLVRLQQVLQQIGGTVQATEQIPLIVQSLKQALGYNVVTIQGVPASTHFAHVLTEADYRMKLIGIGLEPVPVPMASYVSRLSEATMPSNSMLRWYFVPDYEAIAVSSDGLAMKLNGRGVKLVDEGEMVDRSGNRKAVGRTNPASRAYALEFTKKFNKIATAQPVYAQLRNLVDLSIAAAYIQKNDFVEKAGWDLGVLGKEEILSVEVLPPPQQVETAINAVMAGGRLVTPIGGGVAIQARKALSQENVGSDDKGEIAGARTTATAVDQLEDGQWWWD